MDDLISRKEAIEALGEEPMVWTKDDEYALGERNQWNIDKLAIETLPAAQPKWIPIKTRPMTEEEREYWSEHYGYDFEGDEAVIFNCHMPEDGQEVWVCFKNGYVAEDVCDKDDGLIGLEGNDDWNDVVAWMPRIRPEPYKTETATSDG